MTSPANPLRLRLRAISPNDAAAITHFLAGDTELALQTATIPIPYTIEVARDFLRAADPRQIFAITVADDLVGLIGMIGPAGMFGAQHHSEIPAQPPDELHTQTSVQPLEVGYWVGRIHWGRGYATSALRLLIEEARRRQISRLTADVLPNNPASIRVLENNGFVCQGEIQRDLPQRGGLRRLLHFHREL
jgi:RimJ/RimL family protein N-acetyltransferase